MSNRKRNIQILFCVTPEEKKLIRQKMILSKTRNMGAYLRKMAIDGYIINPDQADVRRDAQNRCEHQPDCKKVNTTGDLYPEEMEELKRMVSEIWHILKSSPLK